MMNKFKYAVAILASFGLLACTSPSEPSSQAAVKVTTTEKLMLSGTGSHDAVEWDFYCDKGRNCGEWSKISVPSNWELEGFGQYDYGHIKDKSNEQGIYRRSFNVPQNWQTKTIKIVFDGVMTDATVLINGEQVGKKHQGGFYRFSYDITPYLEFGKSNEVKVIVDKISSNKSVEIAERQADYWVFGGIFRQVFLQALPQTHVDWLSLDAKANGHFKLDVYQTGPEIPKDALVSAQIVDQYGNPVGKSFNAPLNNKKASLQTQIEAPALWTAETPNLYKVNIELKSGENTLHQLSKTFGFRTFELRPQDGLYLNGEKIILKGVNRHSFRPETGRTLTPQISEDDIKLIKRMNMNAVRMSHYPPDVHFLEAADRLGIYVINELTTWQAPAYDTPTARRLVEQLVKRDQIHPSILMWANGNEGGWNTDVDDDYALYDIQNRPVLHPWELFRNLDTDHYPTYQELVAKLEQNEVFMPTEFLHGLYDGGHGAGLRDFWDFMMSTPLGAGGFLWVLADEGVVRTDQQGRIDTDGNHAPDGLVGPHGELEGSYFTVKDIWSPVKIENLKNGEVLPADFNRILKIKNLYDFIDLSDIQLKWRLYEPVTAFSSDKKLVASKTVSLPAIKPDETGNVELNLPDDWQQQGWLEVEFVDAHKDSIWTNSWPVKTPEQVAATTSAQFNEQQADSVKELKIVKQDDQVLQIAAGNIKVSFNAKTGLLESYQQQDKSAALTQGPRLIRSDDSLHDAKAKTWFVLDPTQPEKRSKMATRLKLSKTLDAIQIEVINPPTGITKLNWTVHRAGYLSLDLDYQIDGEYVLHGIAFNYPKSDIARKKWLGDGPYRVWANRLEGVNFSVWENEYNEGIAGENWVFPEFKGYFADINWLTLESEHNRISFSTQTDDLFARVMQPDDGKHPANTLALEYQGEISFLHRISPIGTKFYAPEKLGPQSENVYEKGVRNIQLDIF